MRGEKHIKRRIDVASLLTEAILFFVLIYTNTAYAALVPDAGTMLQNLTVAVPQLTRLVTALAYVMGLFMLIKGTYALKQYGESKSMMSTEHSLKGPMLFIFVGTMLLYLPTSIRVGTSSFWKNSTPLVYVPDPTTSSWSIFINDIFMVIQLVGVISFVRGMVKLTHLSGSHGQPGTLGTAMAHIIAGILCINMYQFLQVIFNTLGYGQF